MAKHDMFQIDKSSDKTFYIMGWCIVAVLGLLGVILHITGLHLSQMFGQCMFHVLTGFYCPGCGGTRAMRALFAGEVVQSFVYHPFVPFIAVLGTWFMVSQTIERVSRGHIQIAMHFREAYLWIALGIIVVNFLVKNLALFVWNVDLMAF